MLGAGTDSEVAMMESCTEGRSDVYIVSLMDVFHRTADSSARPCLSAPAKNQQLY